MMLRLEAESGEAEMAGSLMDRVLMGMISRLSAYPLALFRWTLTKTCPILIFGSS
jgi:hypothetical protein